MLANAAVHPSREWLDKTRTSADWPSPSFLPTEAGDLVETCLGIMPDRCHLLTAGPYLQVWGDANRFYRKTLTSKGKSIQRGIAVHKILNNTMKVSSENLINVLENSLDCQVKICMQTVLAVGCCRS